MPDPARHRRMKNPATTKGKRKIRFRFKAKDLERVDLEELRRRLEATKQPQTETVPEPVEEEPVVVVPPESFEPPEVVEPKPQPEPREPWKWADLPWKGVAIGTISVAVFALLIWGITSLLGDFGTQQAAGKAKESKPKPSKPDKKVVPPVKEPVPVEPRDWPDVPDTDLDPKWLEFGARNDPEVQFLLASHLAGELDKDPKPAIRVFENLNRSVKEDHPRIVPAIRNLAWCYEYGVGTEVDEVEAEKWEARADEAGLSLVDGTKGDSRVSRALVSGLVLLGWIGFLTAARGIWRGRLDKLVESSREQTRSMAYFDVVAYAKTFFGRFETLLIFAVFLGLTWTVYRAGIPATRIFFLAMVIGLPASTLLLFIVGRLGWEPFPKFDYHRGGDMSAQRSDSTQFNLIIRKLPLLFILSLLLAQFFPLAWGALFSICLVGIICSRGIDLLPQLDIWPGPNCKLRNPQTIGWFFRRTPLHIIYLLVFFTLGWAGLIVCALLLETPYTFSTDPLRRYFVIIHENEPPRLAEKTADMMSRRMRHAPAMLSFWWALWATFLVYGAVVGSVKGFFGASSLWLLGLPGLAWFGMGALLKQMIGDKALFRWLPWIVFASWLGGLVVAILGMVVSSITVDPQILYIVTFIGLIFLMLYTSDSESSMLSESLMRKDSIFKKLKLCPKNEGHLISLWRVKSPHLLFTSGCIGMLLALGSGMLAGENLRNMIIGTFGIGLLVIVAIGAVLLKFDVKLLPQKHMENRANPDAVANRYFWGALTENAFFIFAGAMVLAWLVNSWQDIGGFDYYWARVLFLGLPVMCLGICAGVRFPALHSSLLVIVMIGLLGLELLPKYYLFQEYKGAIPEEGEISLVCVLVLFFCYLFFPDGEALGKRLRRYFIGVFAPIRVLFESLRHVSASRVVPKPWIHPTVDGLQVRWGMLLGTVALVIVLLTSAGTWVYGEKRVIPDVIELSGNSYILLESGFLLPADSLP
jgi:hypothetical protein